MRSGSWRASHWQRASDTLELRGTALTAGALRRLYITRLDELLDDRTMLGTSWACREALRGIATSSVAELAHHLRHETTMAQIKTIIQNYSRCAHVKP